MASGESIMGSLFLFQIEVGLLGNILVFCLYIWTFFTKHTQKLIDIMLNQLANSLVLFSRGISQILDTIGFKHFLGEVECKVSLYTQRVARGVGAVLSAPPAS